MADMNNLRVELGIQNSFDSKVKNIDNCSSERDNKYQQIEEQEYDFWQRRSKDARQWALLINTTNVFYQVIALLSPQSPRHFAVNVGYSVNSVIMWSLIIQTYYNESKLQRNMEIILLATHIRNIIRVWDFEDTKIGMTFEQLQGFQTLVIMQVLVVFANFNYLMVFLKKTFRQKCYGFMVTLSIEISIFAGVYGRDGIKFSNLLVLAIFMSVVFSFSFAHS